MPVSTQGEPAQHFAKTVVHMHSSVQRLGLPQQSLLEEHLIDSVHAVDFVYVINMSVCNDTQNDYPMQTPSPGAFVTPSPSGYSHALPPALPYRAPAPARGAIASQTATPSTHPGPSPSQVGAGSSQRWKFMDDTGKLRKVSGRLFSEPSASLRYFPKPLSMGADSSSCTKAPRHQA